MPLFLRKPVINIGNRQKGKIYSNNIVHSKNTKSSILKSIEYIETENLKKNLKISENPYKPQKNII